MAGEDMVARTAVEILEGKVANLQRRVDALVTNNVELSEDQSDLIQRLNKLEGDVCVLENAAENAAKE